LDATQNEFHKQGINAKQQEHGKTKYYEKHKEQVMSQQSEKYIIIYVIL